MEEYKQLTLTDWIQIKEDIRRKLAETAENFVYIGCRLKEIELSESYKQDGAADIYEFAEKEYGLHRSTTQRFMAINTKFSVGGNSTELLPEYKSFGSSKLQEMLTLSEDDCRLLTAKATVKEIRDLKAFSKQESEEEDDTQAAVIPPYTPLEKCIIDYFSKQEKRQTLNAVLRMYLDNEPSEEIIRQQVELINPSEYCTHNKGIIYLFMYELSKGISYKTVGKTEVTKMDWVDFIEEIAKIYSDSYGPDTWCNYYGPIVETVEPVKEEKKEIPKTPEKPQNTESTSCATSHKKEIEEDDIKEPEEEETEEESEEQQEQEETMAADEDPMDEAEPIQEKNTDIVENPYYKLQQTAVEAAEKISHLVKLHYHITIEPDMMRRIKVEVDSLAAVVEQLEQMGEEN